MIKPRIVVMRRSRLRPYSNAPAMVAAVLVVAACGDDGSASPPNDTASLFASGDEGPRLASGDSPPSGAPLRPGRRYALYRSNEALVDAWRTLFFDAGLTSSDVPPFPIPDDRIGVGIYLGAQDAEAGGDAEAFAREYDIALDVYADGDGAPVVQVNIDVMRNCGAVPNAIEPSPFAIAAVALPEGTTDRPVRFVDVVRERDDPSCGGPPPDPAALVVRSPLDTSVTLGIVPEPRAPDARGYRIGGVAVPPDDALQVRVPVLPGPYRELRASALDGAGPPLRLSFSTDAPSELFSDQTTFEQYASWQRELAGTEARDCGALIVEGTDGASFRCLVEALGSDEPFVAALGNAGIDSVDWSGAVRDPTGRLFATRFGTGLESTGTLWGSECETLLLSDLDVSCADTDADRPEVFLADGTQLARGGPNLGTRSVETLLRGDLVVRGDLELSEPPAYRVFADRTTFDAFFTALVGNDASVPTPDVDFDRHRVVFATRGLDTTPGADIAIVSAYEANGSVEVTIETTNPFGLFCPDDAPRRALFALATVLTEAEPFRFRFFEERRFDPATCP